MKIFLLKDVKGVGRKGDVKEVSEGYARNFLILRGLAKAATFYVVSSLEHEREEKEHTRVKRIEHAQELVVKAEKMTFRFRVKVGAKGETFGSITKRDIEVELARQGFRDVLVLLEHPIKVQGIHFVLVDFGEKTIGKIRVTVEPDQETENKKLKTKD